jgi:ribosomal protein S18 acetylase RimI-like enzyme
MQLNDLPAVFRLGQRLFTAEDLPTLYRSWDDHEILELFRSDEETCLVAEDDGTIVGFALGCMMDKPGSAHHAGGHG